MLVYVDERGSLRESVCCGKEEEEDGMQIRSLGQTVSKPKTDATQRPKMRRIGSIT
jgi:hypothetical protein